MRTATQQIYSNYNVEMRNKSNNRQNNFSSSTVENKKNQSSSKFKKRVRIGMISASILGVIYAIKKHQVKDIKNIQKAFQEVFMRNDITPEIAKSMKERYLALENIKDTKEYAKALFEETKKNFGFENHPVKLTFGKVCDDTTLGTYSYKNLEITITPLGLKKRNKLLETMHHEFRHAKQHAISPNLVELDKVTDAMYEKCKDDNFDEYAFKHLADYTKELFDGKVAKEYQKTAMTYLIDELKNIYKSDDNVFVYVSRFREQDARKAQYKIAKYVKEKAITFDQILYNILAKLSKFCLKVDERCKSVKA